MRLATSAGSALAFLFIFVFSAAGQQVIPLQTRPGVTETYFLASAPKNPQAIAILFPGGGGWIKIRNERGRPRFGQDNFLVRVRADFVKRGVVAAIVDAPSDQQSGEGMDDVFRLGADHFTDISAVVADVKRRFPDKPVFLIGTSRGTISAAALGARFGDQIAGVVLTSTLFSKAGSSPSKQGLSKFDFATIKVPLLFVHHVSDQCQYTQYADAQRQAGKYPLITVMGGDTPKSGPCDPYAQHGFYGKESETVEEMVNWMLKKPHKDIVK
jgi:alpha-beta hydrolase superfamily lysophospholipase